MSWLSKAVHSLTTNASKAVSGLSPSALANDAKVSATHAVNALTHPSMKSLVNSLGKPIQRAAFYLDKKERDFSPKGGTLGRDTRLGQMIEGRHNAANHLAFGLPAYLDRKQGGSKQVNQNALQHGLVGLSVLGGAVGAGELSTGSKVADAAISTGAKGAALGGGKAELSGASNKTIAQDAAIGGTAGAAGGAAGSSTGSSTAANAAAALAGSGTAAALAGGGGAGGGSPGMGATDVASLLAIGGSAYLGYKGAQDLQRASDEMANTLQQIGQPAFNEGANLLKQYDSGQLKQGDLAALDESTASAVANVKQQFAAMGLSGSSQETAALNNVDEHRAVTYQKMMDDYLTQGLSALSTGEKPLADAALARFKGDLEASGVLSQGMANALSGVGSSGGGAAIGDLTSWIKSIFTGSGSTSGGVTDPSQLYDPGANTAQGTAVGGSTDVSAADAASGAESVAINSGGSDPGSP